MWYQWQNRKNIKQEVWHVNWTMSCYSENELETCTHFFGAVNKT